MGDHLVTWWDCKSDFDVDKRESRLFTADDGYEAAYKFYLEQLQNTRVDCVTMWAAIPDPQEAL